MTHHVGEKTSGRLPRSPQQVSPQQFTDAYTLRAGPGIVMSIAYVDPANFEARFPLVDS